jgi:hypothetical protein
MPLSLVIIKKLLPLQPPEYLVFPEQVPPQPVRLMHLKHKHDVRQRHFALCTCNNTTTFISSLPFPIHTINESARPTVLKSPKFWILVLFQLEVAMLFVLRYFYDRKAIQREFAVTLFMEKQPQTPIF